MIRVTSQRPSTPADINIACGRLPFIAPNDVAALQRAATQAGMLPVAGMLNAYQHPTDQSWAYMDGNGRVQRGQHGVQLQGIPGGQRAAPAPVAPPMAPVQTAASLGTQRPPIPASMKAYKIAQMGFVSASNLATVTSDPAFVQLDANTWVHPDGTSISNAGGRITVGWNGHPLSALPYQNGSGWR